MNPLLRLLALLALFFRPAIDDAGGDADAGAVDADAGAADADAVAADDQLDLDLNAQDDGDDENADTRGRTQRVAANEDLEAERRARKAEAERAERAERELAETRARQNRPVQDDELTREEARLRDPATTDLEKWQINANRELRAGRSAAQAALAQAQDVRDQTAFNQLAITEPQLHKRYAVKVEQELAGARRQGYNPSREVIYNQLIAKDMREGKFKRKGASDPAPKKDTVQRGKLPGARSDVTGRGQLSRKDALAKKLDGVQI